LLRIEHLNNVGDLALKLLSLARCYASAPTSKFQVGAVGEGISGALYLGANLEIAGQALPFTVHAEQSVIVSALSHRERGVKLLAVSSPPCGHCRQFLNELGQSAQLRVVVEDKEPTYLGELLPKAFGPADLGVRGALLMHSQWQLSTESGNPDPVAQAGIDAAHLSYSPYTRSPSGVAVAMSDSRIVAAPYVEIAAFNPSLAPILAVLDRLRFNGGISEIQSAVLVETSDSKISQRALTELILTAIAPKIKLRIVTAKIIG
jgi:cytidine deaminase